MWDPTTYGGTQNGSSVGICTRCIHVFTRFAPTCMLSPCLLMKFLHWSSVGSLLRVRCWLGTPFWAVLVLSPARKEEFRYYFQEKKIVSFTAVICHSSSSSSRYRFPSLNTRITSLSLSLSLFASPPSPFSAQWGAVHPSSVGGRLREGEGEVIRVLRDGKR